MPPAPYESLTALLDLRSINDGIHIILAMSAGGSVAATATRSGRTTRQPPPDVSTAPATNTAAPAAPNIDDAEIQFCNRNRR